MTVKRFVVLAMMPVWLSVGCRGPEQEVLDRYLDASQRGDNQTVAALSMVAFPEDVESWNILEISDERRDPYLVPELRQIVEAAGKGQIHGAIHRTLPLQEVATAHEEMERSEHFGKFVVTVD